MDTAHSLLRYGRCGMIWAPAGRVNSWRFLLSAVPESYQAAFTRMHQMISAQGCLRWTWTNRASVTKMKASSFLFWTRATHRITATLAMDNLNAPLIRRSYEEHCAVQWKRDNRVVDFELVLTILPNKLLFNWEPTIGCIHSSRACWRTVNVRSFVQWWEPLSDGTDERQTISSTTEVDSALGEGCWFWEKA